MIQETRNPSYRDRSWRHKITVALRGWKYGIRGQVNFFVHFFAAGAVIAAGAVLQIGPVAWAILLLCIGLVLTAELFNSSLEILFRGLDEPTRSKSWPALDIAAGAVLCASLTAATVGTVIILHRLLSGSG
jgi:diacylglycerol kinase